ncbi:DUF2779 domain-containing protein [Maritalea porphyrae]|uniref:DUF2779 domain-containing protein n=1 Tax=Maritalea porphyrae TaxID=880732 RepID=UPI0022AEE340|nr:DUF2779 domain-containing protein [Maritalea porphyrae]MCZ4273341.1 DUF2779 domain-containing protein [Maritalea porphyrae]
MSLSKTDFIHYLNCPKALWLMHNKPDVYPLGKFSEYAKKLAKEGYVVEDYVRQLVETWDNAIEFSFQRIFKTDDGLYAKADMIRTRSDGLIDLYEVKSSTSVKESNPHNQLKDAAFQAIVAKRAGEQVGNVFIVHLNKDYVRTGDINPSELSIFSDETVRVNALLSETEAEIEAALILLKQNEIDETYCTCLTLGRARHCDSFDYFNPTVTKPSIYSLPRMGGVKLGKFVSENRFGLDEIGLNEVTRLQQPVLKSYKDGQPYVDIADIESFFNVLHYPLYFLDYETYASAVPIVDGLGPQEQLPFQYSLHVLDQDGGLSHHEYIADQAEQPVGLIEELQRSIGATGSIVVWNKTFENTQNKKMGTRFPDKSDFMSDVVDRTVDLMDVFKTGYVDIAFDGSTSIKKVLPVVVPDLTYEGMEIADGTAAMDGWAKMLAEPDAEKRNALRKSLLAYCELDTLAMVRLLDFARKLIVSS